MISCPSHNPLCPLVDGVYSLQIPLKISLLKPELYGHSGGDLTYFIHIYFESVTLIFQVKFGGKSSKNYLLQGMVK